MKRWFILFLLLCLLPITAMAAGKLDLTTEPGKVTYSFTLKDKTYAVVQYRTSTESGRTVIKGSNGEFEGSFDLLYTPAGGNVTVTVMNTSLAEQMKGSIKMPAAANYAEPKGKNFGKVRDLTLTPTLTGFTYSFHVEGADRVYVKASTRSQTANVLVTPDADGWCTGEVIMPYVYAYSNIQVNVTSGDGKSSLAKGETYKDYQHIEVVPQAEEGRLKGVIVCIDAGHQLHSMLSPEPMGPGLSGMSKAIGGMAQGVATGRKEHMVCIEVAYVLLNELHRQGATVLMTRSEVDQYVSNIDRDNVANDGNAHIMLRLHCDNNSKASKYGICIYAPCNSDYAKAVASSDEYKALGTIMLNDMRNACGVPIANHTGHVALSDNYVGNNWAKMVCFLVEMGYMSNTSDDILLSVPDYQQRLAEGMCQGVYDIALRRGWIQK